MVVDGIEAATVVAPATASELASVLAAASTDRKATIIAGGGTKLAWGRPPAVIDLVVSTSKLTHLVAHRHGDLTATVEAGARLRDVNRQLARHGQWLPVDTAFDAATIGGIVATNDSGPLRHRFGTARDLLIGVELTLADGRAVKAGGTVVKNVAGYDLGRLVTGSFGSYAAITAATFKLAPVPAASGSVGALYDDPESIARDAQMLAAHQLELTALDVQATFGSGPPQFRLLIRIASSPAATDAQLTAVQQLVAGEGHIIRGGPEQQLWRDQVDAPWFGGGVVARVAWLPASLGNVLAMLERTARDAAVRLTLAGRTGVGSGLIRIDGGDVAVTVLDSLRRSAEVGNVVVMRAPRDVKSRVDVWGVPSSAAPVMRAIKQALDPAGILNAGRGPV